MSAWLRLARRLPLTPRYAARDAARHRTRTVPAVAAVAATVAGVVALGIATTSEELAERGDLHRAGADGHRRPRLDGRRAAGGRRRRTRRRSGTGSRQPWPRPRPGSDTASSAVRPRASRPVAGRTSTSVQSTELAAACCLSTGSAGGGRRHLGRARARRGHGRRPSTARSRPVGAVVFTEAVEGRDDVTVRTETWREGNDQAEVTLDETVPADLVAWGPSDRLAGPRRPCCRPPSPMPSASRCRPSSCASPAAWTRAAETRIVGVGPRHRGRRLALRRARLPAPAEVVIVLLVLGALGGVLMLGGTLTATFLALSDARPDLATLSAVGAAPRTRRRVAASYALVIGFVGAVLGAAVGFIPGVAIAQPLTARRGGYSTDTTGALVGDPASYLDIPWLLVVTIVLALPLLTAAVVGLTARSRLPLVARLD